MRFFFVVAAALLVGCGEGSAPKPPSTGFTGSSSSAAGSGGASTSSGSGNGGAGSGAGGQGGGAGSTGAGTTDLPCANDYAYWASSMSFGAPTPKDLGLALSELAYDLASHSISIVLRAKGGAASATLGVSATQDNGMGSQVFPPGQAPAFVPALLSYGGFESGEPQASGVLHLVDQAGPVDIMLNGITVKVDTKLGCSNIVASLDAFIPSSEGGKTLHLKDGDSTIAALGGNDGGGEKDAGVDEWAIRALFVGESISFDFATLP